MFRRLVGHGAQFRFGRALAVLLGSGALLAAVPASAVAIGFPTTTTYTGPTSGAQGSPVTVSATLKVTFNATPVAGQKLTFTLDGATCMGTTNSSGVASCTLTPTAAPGTYTITATFAGAGSGADFYAHSADSAQFTITPGQNDNSQSQNNNQGEKH